MTLNNGNSSIDEVKRMAESKAGQQLLTLFQTQDPQIIQAAMKQASSGDMEQLKQTLASFIAKPEAQKLIRQLEKNRNE